MVALGPPFTSKPIEIGFLFVSRALAAGSSSQRFSRVPNMAYIFMYARVFESVKTHSSFYNAICTISEQI
jgi:hypothetical protein